MVTDCNFKRSLRVETGSTNSSNMHALVNKICKLSVPATTETKSIVVCLAYACFPARDAAALARSRFASSRSDWLVALFTFAVGSIRFAFTKVTQLKLEKHF